MHQEAHGNNQVNDMTILYYTCNADHPQLEDRVRATIVEHSDGLPIVSVSHYPIDFGHNIVVGDIGRSWQNVFMQQRLGAEYATTKYLAICEADCLLPQTFFAFRPPHENIYCWPEYAYITFMKRPDVYYRKDLRQTIGIVGRDHLLRVIDAIGDDGSGHMAHRIARVGEVMTADMGSVVTLKTDRQMHRASPFSRMGALTSLPEWGPAVDMWKKYL